MTGIWTASQCGGRHPSSRGVAPEGMLVADALGSHHERGDDNPRVTLLGVRLSAFGPRVGPREKWHLDAGYGQRGLCAHDLVAVPGGRRSRLAREAQQSESWGRMSVLHESKGLLEKQPGSILSARRGTMASLEKRAHDAPGSRGCVVAGLLVAMQRPRGARMANQRSRSHAGSDRLPIL